MQRKLTITVADEIYQGVHRTVGRGASSRLVEDPMRPADPSVGVEMALDAEFRAIAADVDLEFVRDRRHRW